MADAAEQKRTRLERIARDMEQLEAKKTEIDRKLKEAKGRVKFLQRRLIVEENRKKRKMREREVFGYGGLCEIAGLIGTDKGAVLGVLLWAEKKFREEPEALQSFKTRGDAVLAERQEARKAKAAQNP
jgi:DNA repair exonuclease SbcCD ATPase subunit